MSEYAFVRAGTPAAVLLTNTLIRDYLLNYARPLIYTTSLSNLAVIAASCSFDLLEDGTADRVGVAYMTLLLRTYIPHSSQPAFSITRHTSRSASVPPSPRRPSRRAFSLSQSTSISPRRLSSRPQSYPS